MRSRWAIRGVIMAAVLSMTVQAEIEKIAHPAEGRIEFMWWPKVALSERWERDELASRRNYINLWALKGQDAHSSPVVLYARAIYHEQGDTAKQLAVAISEDHEGFLQHYPGSKVEEIPAVETADRTKLRTFQFTPQSEGRWDIVAYGHEPRYVLMFCISANSQEILEANRAEFLAMVRSYSSHGEQ